MEKTIEAKRTSKGIRMDVYVAENGGTVVHDIEMQTSREDDLQKRIRYYNHILLKLYELHQNEGLYPAVLCVVEASQISTSINTSFAEL